MISVGKSIRKADHCTDSVIPSFSELPMASERISDATETPTLLNWLDSQRQTTAVNEDAAVDLGAGSSFSQPAGK